MLEEQKMQLQENKVVNVITSYNDVPYFIIENDLVELGQEDFINEVQEIKDYYENYEDGIEFVTEGTNGEYIPSDVRFAKSALILNKEARFLFSNSPTFNINVNDVDGSLKEQNTILQDYLDKVLEKNNFNNQIIKACKDCFVGKRIAIVLNFNDEKQEISVTFLKSLEFLYKLSNDNQNKLEKFICFYNTTNTSNKIEQVWFKKTYELLNEVVYVTEHYYDGLGNILDDTMPYIDNMATKFNEIPAVIVLNDGLIGDTQGKSELKQLLKYESIYSKLANEDIDIERKGMNPVAYAIDASEQSTKNLSRAPGSFWDIQTDYEGPSENPPQAKVGLIEPSMSYSGPLKTTLDRIEQEMYSEVDVPNVNSEKLMGIITSGKTIAALYWGLVVRCDEKMLAWEPALRYIAEMIIKGGKLYPNCIIKYTEEALPDLDFEILVENNYPLPEDEQEEKNQDITEVDAKLMSRKAYLKKWRKLSDKEAEEEILQIKAEQDLLDNSYVPPYTQESPESSRLNENELDNKNLNDEEEGQEKAQDDSQDNNKNEA